jgi:CIC family chloride channel protein
LTTSLTIGSGGSAGVFGPSMVIGGTLGTAVGQVMHHIAPSLVPHPAAFMIVGMAGFFSAAANTPLSTIFMVSEMTGSYELLIPAMWVCAIAFLAARRWTLYRSQVPSKLDSPAHFGEFAAEILADAPVSEVYKSTRKHAVIPGERKITKVFSEASRTSKRIFPVAGADGNVIGYFRLSDLTGALQNPAKIVQQTLARNLVLPNRQVVKLDDPVEKALDMMAHQHADEVLVTADDGTGRVIGIITSADLMLYYSCRLSQIRSEQAKELEAEGEEEAGPD